MDKLTGMNNKNAMTGVDNGTYCRVTQ